MTIQNQLYFTTLKKKKKIYSLTIVIKKGLSLCKYKLYRFEQESTPTLSDENYKVIYISMRDSSPKSLITSTVTKVQGSPKHSQMSNWYQKVTSTFWNIHIWKLLHDNFLSYKETDKHYINFQICSEWDISCYHFLIPNWRIAEPKGRFLYMGKTFSNKN